MRRIGIIFIVVVGSFVVPTNSCLGQTGKKPTFCYSNANSFHDELAATIDKRFINKLECQEINDLATLDGDFKSYTAGSDYVIWPKIQKKLTKIEITINIYKTKSLKDPEKDAIVPYFSAQFEANDINKITSWVTYVIAEIEAFTLVYDPTKKETQNFRRKSIYLDVTVMPPILDRLAIASAFDLETELVLS